jgi:O-antigen ligase
LWCGLVLLVVGRLWVDVPRYGVTAVRDALTIVEAGFFFVGYRLGRDTPEETIRFLRWVFLASAGCYALYPMAEAIASSGPTVGIQRPVPLLGQYAGAGPAAVTGFFFMALVRPFGVWSYAVAAAFLTELLLFQARGDYVALAVATALLLAYAKAGKRAGRVRSRVAAAMVAAAVAATLLFPLAPQGRLGSVSPEFYGEHLQTLLGREGPGSGTISHRLEMIRMTLDQVTAVPTAPLIGVGLGPDLIGGFAVEGVEVRKPHNDYLEAFARLGIAGLALFLGLLASIGIPILRAARGAPPSLSRVLWWVTTMQVAYLTIAAFQPLLAFPYGTIPLFMLGGFGLALAEPHLEPAAAGCPWFRDATHTARVVRLSAGIRSSMRVRDLRSE